MEFLMLLVKFAVAVLNTISLVFLLEALFEHRMRNGRHWIGLFAATTLLSLFLIVIPVGAAPIRTGAYLTADFLIICLFRGKFLMRFCII